MEQPVSALDAAILRVHDQAGTAVGAGLLVGPREVLTCAHVVSRALGEAHDDPGPKPSSRVIVDFPLVAPGERVEAEVVVWHPPQADERGDVAGLRLIEDPPPGAHPARLVDAPDVWDHPFRALGFPPGHNDGVWASGRLLGRQATGWVQLDDDRSAGFPVGPGFSGGPIWDGDFDAVVGLTVAAEARLSVRTAYLIPTRTLIELWPEVGSSTLSPCPYRGLASFRERDKDFFHGREELAGGLAELVARSSLIAVIGPSGSGKSSLVFAGALPRLRQRPRLVIATCRPATGPSPLGALAGGLLPLLEPDMTESEQLGELPKLAAVLGEGRLIEVIGRLLATTGADELLVVVDQFEELFARGREEARRFIDLLLEALAPPPGGLASGLRVLLTLRVDFLGQALEHAELAEVLRDSLFPVGQMTREQLQRVIEEPAAGTATYEAGLVERILDDVGTEPGNLPLLEFALTLLWERQIRGVLTHDAYEELGGVAGALAGYAERVYLGGVPEAQRDVARRLLVQLVRPSESAGPTRRMARRADFGEHQWAVAQSLAATRLVVTGRGPDAEETVELAHEALISRWDRLRQWVETDRAFRSWQERLRIALGQWEASGRNKGALLGGLPLAEAEQWLAARTAEIASKEQVFIRASHTRHRRAIRRLQALTIGVAVLLLAAAVLSVGAAQQRRRARESAARLASRALVDEAQKKDDEGETDLSVLLGVAAFRVAETPEAQGNLLRQYSEYRDVDALLAHSAQVGRFTLSNDGRTMASIDVQGAVRLWDLTGQRPVGMPLTTIDRWFDPIALSPDGRMLASGSSTGEIVFWDVATRSRSDSMQAPSSPSELAFSPDGGTLASAIGAPGDQTSPDKVLFWDVAKRSQVGSPLTMPGEGRQAIEDLMYGPDSHTLITAVRLRSEIDGPYQTIIWDLESDPPTPTPLPNLAAPAISRDGKRLAAIRTVTDDRGEAEYSIISLWDITYRSKLNEFRTEPAKDLAWGEADHLAISGRHLVIWDTSSGQALGALSIPGNSIASERNVAFGPDNRTLIAVSDTSIALLRPRFAAPQDISAAVVHDLAFRPVGRRMATVDGPDGAITLWDPATHARVGGPEVPPPGQGGDPSGPIAFSPDGKMLATAVDREQAVYLWNTTNDGVRFRGKLDVTEVTVSRTEGPYFSVNQLRFMADGTLLTSTAGRISRWGLNERRRLGPPLNIGGDPKRGRPEGPGAIFAARGNGSEIATARTPTEGDPALGDTRVELWNVKNGKRIGRLPPGHDAPLVSMSFSPDGKVLASADINGRLNLWDMDRRKRMGGPLTEDIRYSPIIAFTPGARRLILAYDGRLAIWDPARRVRLLDADTGIRNDSTGAFSGPFGGPFAVAPAGRTIAFQSYEIPQLLNSFDPSSWARDLCHLVGRDLREEEWRLVDQESWRRRVCN